MTSIDGYPGRYVRMDGEDGVGKTTQLELAKQYNDDENLGYLFVREPGGTPFGMQVRELILHDTRYDLDAYTEYLLYAADRSFTARTVITDALQDGRGVISDRGVESAICYQGAAGNVPIDVIEQVAKKTLPEFYFYPDALVILALSAAARQRRLETKHLTETPDKLESRDSGYFRRVSDQYKQLSALPYATVVDCDDKTAEEVFAEVRPLLFGPDHA